MTIRRNKNVLFATMIGVWFTTILPSCSAPSSNPPVPTPPEGIPPKQFVSDAEVIEYFRSQLDTEPVAAPQESTFHEQIPSLEVKAVQEKVWTLWSQANKDRLEKSGLNKTSFIDVIYWDLPKGENMPLYIIQKGEKPQGGYPLFITLHGGGQYPNEPSAHSSAINGSNWGNERYQSRYSDDSPSLHFVPRMPDDRIGQWHLMPERVAFRRIIQLAVLKGLVDPDRIYLSGTSQGGYGTIKLGAFMPDYFAALAPIAAAQEIDRDRMQSYRNAAFYMKVGEFDYDYSRARYAKKWRECLDQMDSDFSSDAYPHIVEIIEGKGHGVSSRGLTKWMLGYKRTATPSRITYFYTHTDDGYPQAVYNLDFSELVVPKGEGLLIDLKRLSANKYDITIVGKYEGRIGLFLDDKTHFEEPIAVTLNGRDLLVKTVSPARGAMIQSVALFGDPRRIFPAKIFIGQ